jgi:hypothetical protein
MLTHTTRRAVFYFLIFAFLAIGAIAVFYAQGYRLDPVTFRINKIGAVYVKTSPADSRISVGGEPVTRSFALFDTGVFVSDLFPKRYEIAVERDGYMPWRQHIDVEPSRVVELKHVVLVPDTAVPVARERVADFWMIGDSAFLRNASGTFIWNGVSVPGDRVQGWTGDGNRLLTRNERTGDYYWTDLGNGSSTPLNPLLARLGIRQARTALVSPDTENSSRLLIYAGGGLSWYELQTNRLVRLATTTIAEPLQDHLTRSSSRFAWTSYDKKSNNGTLFLADTGNGRTATSSELIPGETKKIAWGSDDVLAILQMDGTLYLYRPSTGTLAGRAQTVRDFTFSADGRMLAALENQSIEIFSLADTDYWRLNVPDTSSVAELSWYRDDRHLFLHYSDRIVFLDLDDRALQNLIPVARTAHAQYDPETNMLYYLMDNALLRLAFPS